MLEIFVFILIFGYSGYVIKNTIDHCSKPQENQVIPENSNQQTNNILEIPPKYENIYPRIEPPPNYDENITNI